MLEFKGKYFGQDSAANHAGEAYSAPPSCI